jgi:hypothetical protein
MINYAKWSAIRMLRAAALNAPLLAAAAACPGALFSAPADAAPLTGTTTIAGPPAGFDAVHASDAALAAYALPPRPNATTEPGSYAKWARAMSAHTTRMLAPLVATSIYHGPMHAGPAVRAAENPATGANTAVYSSYNWSGSVVTNTLTSYNSSRSFYYLLSDYVIPTANNATCDGTWDYSSQWDGIDGWNSGDVLQAGTEADAYCSGGSTSTYYSAWIEWYPYSESRISGFAVSPGDDMFVEVWNTSPIVGYAYLENINTGQTVEYQLTPPSGTSLIGNSAEWVVERPSVGGGLATLSAYALDYMSGASAYNFKGTAVAPGGTSGFLVDMLNNSGTVISAPSLLGKNAVEYVYQ